MRRLGPWRVTRRLLWGLVVGVGTVGAGLAAWPSLGGWVARTFGLVATSDTARGVLEKLEVYGRVPDFSLIERSGRRVSLTDLTGKVWIANFFYTECTDTCPLQSAHMARLQADLAEAEDVRLVSISVEPEHDTPGVLAEYAAGFRADPERWLFLTGPRDAIYRLAIEGFRLGVVDQAEKAAPGTGQTRTWLGPVPVGAHPVPNPARKPIIHSSRFVLVDRRAQIRGYYHGTDWESLKRLRESVNVLLREPRRSSRSCGSASPGPLAINHLPSGATPRPPALGVRDEREPLLISGHPQV